MNITATNMFHSVTFFWRSTFVGSAWSFGFFIPATTANDLGLRRIFYPRFYSLHLFSYLNSWERASIFPFQCWVLNKGTTGTILITSLVWCGPWQEIEPGTSCTRSQHYTTRLSRNFEIGRLECRVLTIERYSTRLLFNALVYVIYSVVSGQCSYILTLRYDLFTLSTYYMVYHTWLTNTKGTNRPKHVDLGIAVFVPVLTIISIIVVILRY